MDPTKDFGFWVILAGVLWGLSYLVRIYRLVGGKCNHRWVSDPQITVLLCANCPAMIHYEKGSYELTNKLLERAYYD